MKLKQKEKWLRACRELLAYYRQETFALDKITHTCPFCSLSKCSDCIWIYFEGITCEAWAAKEFPIIESILLLRIYQDKRLAKKRIPMLQEWIKKLKKEIKED